MFRKGKEQGLVDPVVPRMLITRSELGLDGKGGYRLVLTIPIGFSEFGRLGDAWNLEPAPGVRLSSTGGSQDETTLNLIGFTRPEQVEQAVTWLRQFIRNGLQSIAVAAREFEGLPTEWDL